MSDKTLNELKVEAYSTLVGDTSGKTLNDLEREYYVAIIQGGDGGGEGQVISVNGQQGIVTLGAADVNAAPKLPTGLPVGVYVLNQNSQWVLLEDFVTSVNGQVGDVTLVASDVDAAPELPAGVETDKSYVLKGDNTWVENPATSVQSKIATSGGDQSLTITDTGTQHVDSAKGVTINRIIALDKTITDSIPDLSKYVFRRSGSEVYTIAAGTSVVDFKSAPTINGVPMGGVSSVNGELPDASGSVTLDVGVKTVNGMAPDSDGNVELAGAGEIILDKIQGDETSTGTPSLTVEGTDAEPFTTFYYRTKEGKLARLWYDADAQEWHHDVSGAGYNIDIDGSSYITLAKDQPVDFPKGITINGMEIPNIENAGTVKSVNGSESDVNGEVTLTHLLSKTGSLVGGTKFEVAYSSDNGGYSYYRYKTNSTSYDKITSHHSGAWNERHRGSSITKSIGNYDYQKVSSIGIVDFPKGITVKGKALPDADKVGTVKDVNGEVPNASGSVALDVGVKTINGKAPDADGNVDLAGGGSGGIVLGNMVLNGGFSQMHLSGCHKYQDMEEYPVGGSMFMYPAINPSSTFEISGQSNINVESTNRGFKQIRLDTITNSSSGVIAFELNTEKMFEAIETGIGWITISFIAEGNLSHYLCSNVRGRIGRDTNTFVTFAKSTSYKLIGKTSEGEPIYRYFSTYKVNNILNHKYWNIVRNNPNSLAYLKLQSSTSITSNANIRIHSLSVHHSGEEALWSQINENSSYSVPSGEIASYSDALDSENMALANERYKYAVVDLEVLVNNYKLGKLPIIDNKYIPLLKVPNDSTQREGKFIIYAATSTTDITKKYSKSLAVSHATDANGDRYACLYNVNLDSFIAEIDTGTITTSDLKYAMCSISSQPYNYGITGI